MIFETLILNKGKKGKKQMASKKHGKGKETVRYVYRKVKENWLENILLTAGGFGGGLLLNKVLKFGQPGWVVPGIATLAVGIAAGLSKKGKAYIVPVAVGAGTATVIQVLSAIPQTQGIFSDYCKSCSGSGMGVQTKIKRIV